MVDMPESVANRTSKRLRSVVWNDFTKIMKKGKIMAVCNNCSREFVAYSGTSTLKKHLRRCLKNLGDDTGNQLFTVDDGNRDEVPVLTPQPSKIHNDGRKMVEIPESVANNRSKRLRSAVWNDFTKIMKKGKIMAVCNSCSREFVAYSGTSTLKKHLRRCLNNIGVDAGNQLITVNGGNGDETPVLTPQSCKIHNDGRFDQKHSQFDLARMVILHDYPFSLVEQVGFTEFVNNLQPQFKMIPPDTVKAECLEIFMQEKEKLYEVLDKLPVGISLTSNIWTSYQNDVYLCLAAQYIDEAWSLQKKVLNFVMVDPQYTGESLSQIIMTCLKDWNIYHKVFALTTESSFLNDNVASRVRDLLTQKKMLVGNGSLFHVQCATHFLSLIAQDGLTLISVVVNKVRESVKYVKSSQTREQKFKEVANQAGIHGQRGLCLDIPSEWNSTFLMLEVALEYKDAFLHLQKHDPGYSMLPSSGDWEVASLMSDHLKVLYEVANDFLIASKRPSSNLFFPAICAMKFQLHEWSKSDNAFVCSMASKMKESFDKYWNLCNTILAVAVVLDPRFKMKLVDYYYQRIYGSDAAEHIKKVDDIVMHLYNEYAAHPTSTPAFREYDGRSGSGQDSESNNYLLLSGHSDVGDKFRGFDEFLNELQQKRRPISDLDVYLEEDVCPRNHGFNVLSWWKVNSPKYPILSRMARDILAIPMSAIAFDSTFNPGCRVLDPYKSSLDSHTVEALICAKDWLLDEFGGEYSFFFHQKYRRHCNLFRGLSWGSNCILQLRVLCTDAVEQLLCWHGSTISSAQG